MHAVSACVTLAVLSATFNSSGYVPVAPFLVSRTEYGLLLTAQGAATFLSLVPAGLAVDRFGCIPVLKNGMGQLAVSMLLSAVSTNLYCQLAGRVLNGAGGSVMFNAGMAMVIERFAEPERGQNISTVLGVGTMGNLIGPPIASSMYAACTARGVPEPQALPMLAPLAFLIASFAILQRVPQKHADPSSAHDDPLAQPMVQEKDHEADGAGGHEERLLSEEHEELSCASLFCSLYAAVGVRAWVIAAVLASTFGATTALQSGSALDLHAHGYAVGDIGLAPIPAGVAQMVLSRVGGRFCDTHNRRVAVMIAGPLLLAVGLIATAAAPDDAAPLLPRWSLAMFLSAGAMAIVDAATISEMANLAAEKGVGHGQVVTSTELAVSTGQALGPFIGYSVLQVSGSVSSLCTLLSGIALVVSLACMRFMRLMQDA